MRHLKTENCIICGKKAVIWHGHVVAKERMALGNYIDKKVISGFCEQHKDKEVLNGQTYNNELMGKCIPLFPL